MHEVLEGYQDIHQNSYPVVPMLIFKNPSLGEVLALYAQVPGFKTQYLQNILNVKSSAL